MQNKCFLKPDRAYLFYGEKGKLLGAGLYKEYELCDTLYKQINAFPVCVGYCGIELDEVENFIEIAENYKDRWSDD